MGDYALAGSDIAFVNIPQSLRNIGAYAFAGTPITEITIPAGVISISPAAFAGCDNLASINVALGNALYTASEGVLYERSDLGRVLLQYATKAGASYTVPSDVVAIKSKAFDGAEAYKSLVVPDTVTSIEEGAFFGLGSLVSLTVPFVGLSVSSPSTLGGMFGAVTENTSGAVRQGRATIWCPPPSPMSRSPTPGDLANYAFQNCRLASVNLGNKLETIGIYAFENCTADVVFGAGSIIDRIGVYAFAGFAGQSVAIPDSVVNIDEYAFRGAAVKRYHIRAEQLARGRRAVRLQPLGSRGPLPARYGRKPRKVSYLRAWATLQGFRFPSSAPLPPTPTIFSLISSAHIQPPSRAR